MGLEVKVNAKFLQDYLQEYVDGLWDMVSDTPSDFTDLLDIMVVEEEALNV